MKSFNMILQLWKLISHEPVMIFLQKFLYMHFTGLSTTLFKWPLTSEAIIWPKKIIKILTLNENLRNISRANGWSKSCKSLTSASIMALLFIKMDMFSATEIKKVFLATMQWQSLLEAKLLYNSHCPSLTHSLCQGFSRVTGFSQIITIYSRDWNLLISILLIHVFSVFP